MKKPTVYIMTNKRNGALYTGVTSDLSRRVYEHKEGLQEGFTKRYDCKMLVYAEQCSNMREAIAREKQIKAGSRQRKLTLVESLNLEWKDLYADAVL